MDNAYSPKKSLGQHWLNDESVLSEMCSHADLNKNDTVLEIGPGLGSLTEQLLTRVNQVISIEKDEVLAESLKVNFNNQNLKVISQDILTFDFNTLPKDFKVVANIPYYLTSNLIRKLSETTNQPQVVVLLVQKEVAERINANPGSMSILSIASQLFWQVTLGSVVPAKLFNPPPKVDSKIVILKRLENQPIKQLNNQKFFNLLQAAFSQKRKTLSNSLTSNLHMDRIDVDNKIKLAGIDPSLRPQTLSILEWTKLYKVFEPVL